MTPLTVRETLINLWESYRSLLAPGPDPVGRALTVCELAAIAAQFPTIMY